MNEDKNFDKRNALRAELAELMSGLSANTSSIGGWKVIKVYEARMLGKEDPYTWRNLQPNDRQHVTVSTRYRKS